MGLGEEQAQSHLWGGGERNKVKLQVTAKYRRQQMDCPGASHHPKPRITRRVAMWLENIQKQCFSTTAGALQLWKRGLTLNFICKMLFSLFLFQFAVCFVDLGGGCLVVCVLSLLALVFQYLYLQVRKKCVKDY